MIGHHWESAEATIIASRVTKTTSDGMVSIHEFVAEVRPVGAPAFRTVLDEPRISTHFWAPSPGDVVRVHVDVERQKAKFDKDDPQLDNRRRLDTLKHFGQARFDAALAAPVSTPAAPGVPLVPAPVAPADARDPADRLRQLQGLRDEGLIDADEYDARPRGKIRAGPRADMGARARRRAVRGRRRAARRRARGAGAGGLRGPRDRDRHRGRARVRRRSRPTSSILDIGLPDADGRDVCQALRARGVTAPVLFLTARDALHRPPQRLPRRRRRLPHQAVRARRAARPRPRAAAPRAPRRAAPSRPAGLMLDPAAHAIAHGDARVAADADRVPAAGRARRAARRGRPPRRRSSPPAGPTARSSTTTRSTPTSRASAASCARPAPPRPIETARGVGYVLR